MFLKMDQYLAIQWNKTVIKAVAHEGIALTNDESSIVVAFNDAST